MNNAMRDVLLGGAPAVPNGTPTAGIAGATTGTLATPSGASTSVARVQVSIALGFLVAVAILVLLNRAGFKFSVTVGG